MSLNKEKLKENLREIYNNPPESVAAASVKWGLAYDDYAREAEDLSGDSPITLNLPILQQGFLNAFNIGMGLPERNSLAVVTPIGNAFTLYWTGVVFSILRIYETMSVESNSIVTVPGLSPTLISSLSTIFSNYVDSLDVKINQITQAIHDFTLSVVVTISGIAKVGSPPPPIVVVGNIH